MEGERSNSALCTIGLRTSMERAEASEVMTNCTPMSRTDPAGTRICLRECKEDDRWRCRERLHPAWDSCARANSEDFQHCTRARKRPSLRRGPCCG